MSTLDIMKGLRAFGCSKKDNFFLRVSVNIWLKAKEK